jgi:hypothetical protein
VIVRLQPVLEVDLIQARTNEFFPQLVCLAANEGHLQPRKYGHQEPSCPIGIHARVSVGRLFLAQGTRDYQQPVRIVRREAETIEDVALDCSRVRHGLRRSTVSTGRSFPHRKPAAFAGTEFLRSKPHVSGA